MTKALLEFSNVVKRYGDTKVVDEISFTVAPGEFFTLLGPSGCGNTTTLRLLAGLERPDTGAVHLREKTIVDAQKQIFTPAEKRKLS